MTIYLWLIALTIYWKLSAQESKNNCIILKENVSYTFSILKFMFLDSFISKYFKMLVKKFTADLMFSFNFSCNTCSTVITAIYHQNSNLIVRKCIFRNSRLCINITISYVMHICSCNIKIRQINSENENLQICSIHFSKFSRHVSEFWPY